MVIAALQTSIADTVDLILGKREWNGTEWNRSRVRSNLDEWREVVRDGKEGG